MISVCMATYNGVHFIKQQIDSILSQLSEKDELVISDDGSTDGTLDIIKSYKDGRIKLFHHKKRINDGMYKNHRYATENFENALNQVQGDYIFLSDQDDVWLPNKVEHCLNLLKKYDSIVHNYQVIDIEDNIIEKQCFKRKPIHNTIIANVIDNQYRGCCMVFKRDLLRMALPIPEEVVGHDYWLGTLAAYYGKVYYEFEPLMQYRQYSQSVSAYKKTTVFYKIKHRLLLLVAVVKRIIVFKIRML